MEENTDQAGGKLRSLAISCFGDSSTVPFSMCSGRDHLVLMMHLAFEVVEIISKSEEIQKNTVLGGGGERLNQIHSTTELYPRAFLSFYIELGLGVQACNPSNLEG